MKNATVFLICVILAGCMTAEQRYAQQLRQQEAEEAQSRAYTESLYSQCRAVGYQDATDGFRNCVLTLHGQNQARNAQIQGIILQQAIQQQYQRQQPAYTRPRTPVQTNCTRDAWGNVNCTSY